MIAYNFLLMFVSGTVSYHIGARYGAEVGWAVVLAFNFLFSIGLSVEMRGEEIRREIKKGGR